MPNAKESVYDHELILKCSCGSPFDIVHLAFTRSSDQYPSDLSISFRTFYGSPWTRIKKAVKLICSGWLSAYPDVAMMGDDNIRQLHDFCHECLPNIANNTTGSDTCLKD